MQIVEKITDWFIRVLRIAGGLALVGMMMLTVVDVILRRVFNSPIFGSVDIVGFMAVIVLACAMPYTHSQRGHVGVNLLVQRLSSRTQAAIDSITSLISLVLFAIITWQMWLYAQEFARKGEVSMAIEIPKYPFVYFVSVCFGILTLAILIDVVRFSKEATKG
jgi:TRAP-type C4-dicarboxylate transport system permease small subunit